MEKDWEVKKQVQWELTASQSVDSCCGTRCGRNPRLLCGSSPFPVPTYPCGTPSLGCKTCWGSVCGGPPWPNLHSDKGGSETISPAASNIFPEQLLRMWRRVWYLPQRGHDGDLSFFHRHRFLLWGRVSVVEFRANLKVHSGRESTTDVHATASLPSKLHTVCPCTASCVLSLHSGLRLPHDGSPFGSWVLLYRLNYLRVGVECRSLLVTFLESLLRGNAPNHGVSWVHEVGSLGSMQCLVDSGEFWQVQTSVCLGQE